MIKILESVLTMNSLVMIEMNMSMFFSIMLIYFFVQILISIHYQIRKQIKKVHMIIIVYYNTIRIHLEVKTNQQSLAKFHRY